MSIVIPIDSISDSQKSTIFQDLRIKAEKTSFHQREYFSSTAPFFSFFRMIDGQAYLPMRYAINIFSPPVLSKWPSVIFDWKGTLFDYQIEPTKKCLQFLTKNRSIILGAYPGFGKTVVANLISTVLKRKVLVLTPRGTIGEQWDRSFHDQTTAKVCIVPELSKKEEIDIDADVFVCLPKRIDKIPPHILKTIGFLIVDEAHMFCTQGSVKCLLSTQPEYILALSATPERDDQLHRMIWMLTGPESVVVPISKKFEVIHLTTNLEFNPRQNSKGTDWMDLVKKIVRSPERNQLIIKLVERFDDKKILILTTLKEHAINLKNLLDHLGISNSIMIGSDRTYIEARVLIGTISKIGTGFDEKNACPDFSGQRINIVILATSIKSEKLLEQNVGRAFRSENPTVVVITDQYKTLKNHWYIQRRWFLSRGGRITEEMVTFE